MVSKGERNTHRSRLDVVHEFATRPSIWQGPELLAALAACLTPEQVCSAIDPTVPQNETLRGALLRRLTRDCMEGGFRVCHRRLARRLLTCYSRLPADRRRGCGHSLTELAAVAPVPVKLQILRFFLRSPHVDMRRRAYKVLRTEWSHSLVRDVGKAWRTHGDFECALLIVQRSPVRILEAELSGLEEVLSEGWALARLYLRLGAVRPALLKRLAQHDEITHTYVLAKLGRRLSVKDAIRVVERNSQDERIGLLIWSLGQMKLWGALTDIIGRSAEFEEKWVRHFSATRDSYAARGEATQDRAHRSTVSA